MSNTGKHTLKLGLLVASGLLLFIAAIYYMGVNQSLFTPKIIVKSYLRDAAGLIEGNNVRYSGVTVGTVSGVSIVSDTTVLVTMSINQKAWNFIRKDSKVEIGREGLMGSKILLINPGTPQAGRIENNDVLVAVDAPDIDQLVRNAEITIGNTKEITENLAEISRKINHGNGDLARLLNENIVTSRIEQISDQLTEVSQNVNELILKINNGEGDLARLINDTLINHNVMQLLDNLDNIAMESDSLMLELRFFSRELNEGSGLIHHLVYDSTLVTGVDTTIIKLNNGLDEVVKTVQAIRESRLVNMFSGKKKKINKSELNEKD